MAAGASAILLRFDGNSTAGVQPLRAQLRARLGRSDRPDSSEHDESGVLAWKRDPARVK